MGVPETMHVIDPMAEHAPRSTEDVIKDHVAIHIGWLAMGTGVFRRATEDEVLAHEIHHPEAHAQIRQSVEQNLAERASWGQLPAGYEPLRAVEDTDAA